MPLKVDTLPTTHPPFSSSQIPTDFSGLVIKHENLGRYTSLRVGGLADYLFIPHKLEDIQLLLRRAHRENIPVYLLGGGTNLLVADAGVRGWVIKIDRLFANFSRKKNLIVAGAGIALGTLVRKTVSLGFSGLERLYGIPGTMGGAVTQNAGAFGATVSDYLVSITVVNGGGSLRKYTKNELDFSYRSGPLQHDRQVIVEAAFQLEPGDPKSIAHTIKTITRERKNKFPLGKPTAGCFFQNPPQTSAGKLIEQSGMKGLNVGGAFVSTKHANFIVNTGEAAAADIYHLMNLIREKVYDRFGILLETEVKLWGFDD